MNRISREYVGGGRNVALGSQHRRGRSVTGLPKDTDENLDLFSRNRRSHSVASSDESDVSMKLGRISVGSVTLTRSGMDNLLSSVDGGKHDYDWLLTPPETPLFSSSDASESQPTTAAQKSSSAFRSASTTKASRFSMAQLDNSHSSRPTRSSSVTRPSVSTTSYSTYSSTSNRSSSVLNTSSASVTSIPRPSNPSARSTSASSTRPSTPGSRSVSSRPSTPMKCRPSPSPNSFSGERTRTSQNSRPSTPTSRPQIPANLNSASGRTNSRPVTPTRRSVASSLSPVTARSASAGQVLTNGRIPAAASRGSSPSPRIHPLPQPIIPPDFPLETPPNLRTTLPDRPLSAGRSRPSSAGTVRGNADAPGLTNPSRRHSSSPIVTRGRLPEHSGKGRLHANGHDVGGTENQRTPPISSDPASRKPSKSVTSTESTGFGRTISKKSLDMALRHMDIRNGSASANIRPLSGTTLFPQSIRSATLKRQSSRGLDSLASVGSNGAPPTINSNSTISENGNYNTRSQDGDANEDLSRLSAKVSELDIYESSRYDTFLLREDTKNTNWLHSIDDKFDQEPIFDLLPEPFDPL